MARDMITPEHNCRPTARLLKISDRHISGIALLFMVSILLAGTALAAQAEPAAPAYRADSGQVNEDGKDKKEEKPAPGEDYLIGVDDVIEISAIGLESELNQTVTVLSTGKIRVKGIDDDLKAEGLTERQLKEKIAKGLQRLYKDLELTVRVVTSRSRVVSILGVKTPGQFPLRKGMRISHLIALGGGLPDKPRLVAGSLQRNFKVIKLDISKIAGADPVAEADLPLEPNDTVVLDTIQDAPPPSISVIGAVNKPGLQPLPMDGSGVTMSQVVAAAGGPTEKALLAHVTVQRAGKKISLNLVPMLLEGKSEAEEARFELKSGDVVMFPNSERRFIVMGQVNKPGPFTLPEEREMTVLEALATAGGGNQVAELRQATLLRSENGKSVIQKLDLHKLMSGGKGVINLAIRSGDVLYVPMRGRRTTLMEMLNPFVGMAALGFRPF